MERTLSEIETCIGLPPGRGKASESRLALYVARQRDDFIDWLIASGIPRTSAIAAKEPSLVLAYANTAYLRTWRRRVNPSWSTLDDAEIANGLEELGLAAEASAAQSALLTPDAIAHTADAVIGKRLSEIERRLASENAQRISQSVADALRETKLELSDAVRAELRKLGADAAREVIRELMPPRELVVRKLETGTATNVGIQHFKFEILLRAAQARNHRGIPLNIMLVGPTGSGKSHACEALATALQFDFHCESSLDADYKFVGFRDASGNFQSTGSLRIIENGGVLVCDEIDNWNPSALLCLNALLASGYIATPDGLRKRHADCIIISCGNTWGLGANADYVGRTRMDAASLNRFMPKIEWPYDEAMEGAIAKQQGGEEGYAWFCTVREARRRATQQQGLQVIISPRSTFDGIALLRSGFDRDAVIEMTLTSGLSDEQCAAIGLPRSRNLPQAREARLA